MPSLDCPLCQPEAQSVLVLRPGWRIIDAADPLFPGFTRVIWHRHVKEMTDLSPNERKELMGVVFAVEQIMRDTLAPDKINLACLGNQVPHLHWHIIARWKNDPTFPGSVWSPVNPGHEPSAAWSKDLDIQQRLSVYHAALRDQLWNRFE
jgi:diadenosine tetraphosphate (Ap4A) HIT family hydrolase